MHRVPLHGPTGGIAYSPQRWYRCLRCGDTIPSSPTECVACSCRNIIIDWDMWRISVKDESMIEALEEDAPGDPPSK